MPVEYLPGDPGSARIARWSGKWLFATIFGGLGMLDVAIDGAAWWALRRRQLRPAEPGGTPQDVHRAD